MVQEHLNENGVMVVNMNMHTDKEGNINQYLSDTIASVFDTVYTVDVTGSTNRELFAFMGEKPLAQFQESTEELSDTGLRNMMETVAANLEQYEKGTYLLTDDKAPVELLGMSVIDELIQNEVGYYKKVFEEEGIGGLLDSF